MEKRDLISIQVLCKRYEIPVSFINSLKEFQLLDLIVEENDFYVKTTQLAKVEKMMRLHYDLEINFEGLDAIYNLLNQVENLKEEVKLLQNKLRFYEDL